MGPDRTALRGWSAALTLSSIALGACAMPSDEPEIRERADVAIETSDSTSEALVIANPSCGPRDADFVCPFRSWQSDDAQVGALPYCATEDLATPTPLSSYRRLVVAQHGRGSDGDMYLDLLENAVDDAEDARLIRPDETFVLAPQFLEHEEVCNHGLTTEDLAALFVYASDWPWGGRSVPGTGTAPFARDTYLALETLLEQAFARMPNLEEVIFAGQSAGGQLVQRFAIVNATEFPENAHVRYVPANPYSYAYLTPCRPRTSGPSGDLAPFDPECGSSAFEIPETFVAADPDVCESHSGLSGGVCTSYDTWGRGLQDIPEGHYAHDVSEATLLARFTGRDITYLVGEMDIVHDEQCHCGEQSQGEHRRARAESFHRYATETLGADHALVVVPDFSHGGGIFRTPCGRAALFGQPELCTPLTDRNLLPGYGDVLALAHGDIDDDGRDETAVVLRHSATTTSVLVLDDSLAPAAILYAETSYDAATAWTDVAFGDLDGDGVVDLGMTRQVTTGDSWFVRRRAGNGSFTLLARGGADWQAPRSATALDFGDLDGDGDDELAVARGNAIFGTRWTIYERPVPSGGRVSYGLATIASGTSAFGTRVTALAFGHPRHLNRAHLAVAFDRSSGDRVVLVGHEEPSPGDIDAGLGEITTLGLGASWAGGVIRALSFGSIDDDSRHELLVGRDPSTPGYARWFALDDALTGFATKLLGGHGWDASVSAIAVGRMGPHERTIAVGTRGLGGPSQVHLHTLQNRNDTLVVGDTAVRTLGVDSSVGEIAFTDLDGVGYAELVYGRLGATHSIGWIAAP